MAQTIHPSNTDQLIDESTLASVSKLRLTDQDGKEVEFGQLIGDQGTKIVIFIRHFNCGFCQDYVKALNQTFTVEKLRDKQLIVIGCGHWSFIKPYRDLLDYSFPTYADQTRRLYDELGMKCNLNMGDGPSHGLYTQQSFPRVLLTSLINAWKMGISKALESGKMSQNGGEFVFVDGKCTFAHRMNDTRDHLEPKTLESQIFK